jgi:hypothetical protein
LRFPSVVLRVFSVVLCVHFARLRNISL